jgi:hypothetical protein
VRRFIARFALLLATTVLGFAPASAPAGNGPDNPAASALHPQDGDLQQSEAFTTTVAYMLQFYPLWFTYYQSQLIPPNR